MKKLKIWWLAWMCDYPFFRVIYKDGKRTYPLYQAEASGLRDVFNGKMIIDYECGSNFLSNKKGMEDVRRCGFCGEYFRGLDYLSEDEVKVLSHYGEEIPLGYCPNAIFNKLFHKQKLSERLSNERLTWIITNIGVVTVEEAISMAQELLELRNQPKEENDISDVEVIANTHSSIDDGGNQYFKKEDFQSFISDIRSRIWHIRPSKPTKWGLLFAGVTFDTKDECDRVNDIFVKHNLDVFKTIQIIPE